MILNGQVEDRQRAYWAEQMDQGYQFAQQLLHFPVQECGERFASLIEAAAAEHVEMEFSMTKIAGELDRVYFLRESLVNDVVRIGREMNQRGWILKIEDGYRSTEMQRQLVCKPVLFDAILRKCLWELGGQMPDADFVFRRAIVLIANIPKIGTHISGSAIDISVLHRDDGREVWRGNPYLEMSVRTPMRSPFIEDQSLKNRLEILRLMEKHGLIHYPFEFWHFCKGDAMQHIMSGQTDPARYGPVHWDSKTNRVTSVQDSMVPLNPIPVFEQEIVAAMDRIRQSDTNPEEASNHQHVSHRA